MSADKLYRCSKCACSVYCSKECQREHYSVHKCLCTAISSLEELERQKQFRNFDCSYETTMTPRQHQKLVKLIGDKPLIEFTLEGKLFKGLYDTGSMVSLVDRNWLVENFSDHPIHTVTQFIGEEGSTISLKAANNSDVSIEGVVLFQFQLGETQSFTVPFLITSQPLDQPVVGFNVIQHVLSTGNPQDLELVTQALKVNESQVISLKSVFADIQEQPEVLGIVKMPKGCCDTQ